MRLIVRDGKKLKRERERELDWWRSVHVDAEGMHESSRNLERAMRELENLGLPNRILEIGTGGNAFVNFMDFEGRATVEPLLGQMVKEEIGVFSPEVDWIQGMGENLPFADGTFGYAILFNVLDHTLNPAAVLRKTRRVLSKSGVLHFMVDTYGKAFQTYRRVRPDPKHPHTFTAVNVEQLMERSGFFPAKVREDPKPVGWRRRFKIRRYYLARNTI